MAVERWTVGERAPRRLRPGSKGRAAPRPAVPSPCIAASGDAAAMHGDGTADLGGGGRPCVVGRAVSGAREYVPQSNRCGGAGVDEGVIGKWQ